MRTWQSLSGQLAAYQAQTQRLDTRAPTRITFIETRPFSLMNTRQIVANWLSTNQIFYAVGLLGLCTVLGMTTSVMLKGVSAGDERRLNPAPRPPGGPLPLRRGGPRRRRRAPTSRRKRSGSIPAETWGAYRAKFVQPDGRVVDDGNGHISHSESQGYGLLLAYLAGDRAGFEQIWTFTRVELLLRDDGLAAWRWDPGASPHVTDINNASDGDILIAYALGLAGSAWKVPGYSPPAAPSRRRWAPWPWSGKATAPCSCPPRPGSGASDRPDGPVINLSYWVFEAFPTLVRLAPEPAGARSRRTALP